MGFECASVRNRVNNRSGFSRPLQRVFGFTTGLPASISSDDPIDPSYLSIDPLSDLDARKNLDKQLHAHGQHLIISLDD